MSYRLFISEEAREQLRALPDEVRRNIGYRIQLLQEEFTGDTKNWRVRTIVTGCGSEPTVYCSA